MIKLPKSIVAKPEESLSREWLVTNGIGGYASSTIIGANTRRYHGILSASFPPPLERQITLAKLDEEALWNGEAYSLGANEYHDGTIHPEGFLHLDSFQLELGIPTFEFKFENIRIVKRIWMEHGKNTVCIQYSLAEDSDEIVLQIRPFCAFRGYHQDGVRENEIEYISAFKDDQVIVESSDVPYALKLILNAGGCFMAQSDWYRNFLYRVERERGFNCLEDLYTPGLFAAKLTPGGSLCLTATCERETPDSDIEDALKREIERRRRIIGDEKDPLRKQLRLAADQFIINFPDPPNGCATKRMGIIAGYHWFTDWGRDTMISFPGLMLATERFSEARELLLRYIEWANGGMIPNRWKDDGSVEYNTADATLWYFNALHSYIKASGDEELINHLYHQLAEIIDWHFSGVRFGIYVDPSDGLLHAGRKGSQVTWMDACINGGPVTPRIGKPVEINALWHNALNLMRAWSNYVGQDPSQYETAAEKCRQNFRQKFWNKEKGCLCDVIESPNGNDDSFRANQIIAASLPYSPLSPKKLKMVVDAVEAELLTPFGLRTLSPEDSEYAGEYCGGPAERDWVYHKGTVWPWLLGQFADAHFRVYKDKERIAELLKPFSKHIKEAGIGSVNEIFSGSSPHKPSGCIAQAWSVAEILRISSKIR